MNTPSQYTRDLQQEVQSLLAEGKVEDAVRYSGMKLAEADNRLRENHSGESLAEMSIDFIEAVSAHAIALGSAQMHGEVVSVALMGLCTADVYNALNLDNAAPNVARLLSILFESTVSAIDELEPSDEVIDNARALIALEAAMLRHHIDRSGDDPAAAFARQIMADRGITAAADAVIDGSPVSPSDAKAYLSEMIGIISALGLLSL